MSEEIKQIVEEPKKPTKKSGNKWKNRTLAIINEMPNRAKAARIAHRVLQNK